MSAASRVKRLQVRSSNLRRMTMSEFVFLYRGGESGGSPERIQQSMQKWMAWFKELGQNGHVKDQGEPLERTGKRAKGKQKTVKDGAVAGAKAILGRYTLIGRPRLGQRCGP